MLTIILGKALQRHIDLVLQVLSGQAFINNSVRLRNPPGALDLDFCTLLSDIDRDLFRFELLFVQ